MNEKKKLLLLYEKLSSFIQRDIDILKDDFNISKFKYGGKKHLIGLAEGIATNDVNLSWFALGYATSAVLFSKLMRKRSVVITGGWDVVTMPEIGYGAMVNEERIKKTKFTLKNADRVIAVSNSTRKDALQWVDREIEVIHLGFDPEIYKPSGEKEELVITVSNIRDSTIKLKGLETFVKSAKAFPEYEFSVIGEHSDNSIDHLKSMSSKNVEFPGYISHDKLLDYYHKAKVYAQLSYQESFGSALAEAMLCECIPVVTRRGALPEVVGENGLYVEYGDTENTTASIGKALDSNSSLGNKARLRIKTEFPLEKRKKLLLHSINSLF